ncbi:MAG: serine hydrolase, partial [Sphaerochaeta sp.]|nr:serine hydrolase [Sphaerochaeta sp.]
GYTRIDGDFFITTEDNMSSDIGAGNINSTAGDITRWIRAILSGRGGLSMEQVRRMEEIPAGNQAYALGLTKNDVGYGHGGGHPGYTNNVVYNEANDIAIIVVAPFIDYGVDDPSRLIRGHEVRETVLREAFLRYEEGGR